MSSIPPFDFISNVPKEHTKPSRAPYIMMVVLLVVVVVGGGLVVAKKKGYFKSGTTQPAPDQREIDAEKILMRARAKFESGDLDGAEKELEIGRASCRERV